MHTNPKGAVFGQYHIEYASDDSKIKQVVRIYLNKITTSYDIQFMSSSTTHITAETTAGNLYELIKSCLT
jgi:hypothetical protein